MSHIAPVSFNVATTLAAYRMVKISAANTVAYPASAAEICVGITQDTVLDTTASIPVAIGGIARLEFNDTLAAGALVASNSAGQGVPHTNVTAGSYIIGYALETVSATGTIAKVLVMPQWKAIP